MGCLRSGAILACLLIWQSLAAAVPAWPRSVHTVQNAARMPVDCGKIGKPPCNHSCTTGERTLAMNTSEAHPCPVYELSPSGCKPGLTHVTVTPDFGWMPDVCLVLPQAGKRCGVEGQACCLTATAAEHPRDNVRAQCSKGLTCVVGDPASIPYGSRKHMQSILQARNTTAALLSRRIMGSCEKLQDASYVQADKASHAVKRRTSRKSRPARLLALRHLLYKPCDYSHPCPKGSYCAGNEDHYLGGARCLPLPPCGGPHQPCCPPNANGNFNHELSMFISTTSGNQLLTSSQQLQQTPMPYCKDPDSTCLWEPPTVDLSKPRPENDLETQPPQASYSMSVTYRSATCIPGLKQCGEKGQPCCPHAQYAVSNTKMFFRSHTCNAGLQCNGTIDMSVMPPILGLCKGEVKQCGQIGQRCCEHTDAAGWTWLTCLTGQPGAYCSKTQQICRVCPGKDRLLNLAEAAEVGDLC